MHRSAWNRNSPKFTVASNRSDTAICTLQQHRGTPSASKRSDSVAVVATLCIKELRLVTMQLPEKFSPIGPRLNRTSPTEFSEVRRYYARIVWDGSHSLA